MTDYMSNSLPQNTKACCPQRFWSTKSAVHVPKVHAFGVLGDEQQEEAKNSYN